MHVLVLGLTSAVSKHTIPEVWGAVKSLEDAENCDKIRFLL